MTSIIPPSLCDSCKRKQKGAYCDAFPEGIPVGILIGDIDHREPVEGDGGKQWLLDPSLEPVYQGWLQDSKKR